MQRVIILTDKEYEELKSQSPSSILQATADNYKKQNEALTKQVQDLQTELALYQLTGTANSQPNSTRGYTYKDYVREYNFIVDSQKCKTKKAVLIQLAKNLQTSPLAIKESLKEATTNGHIHRDTRTNKYFHN